MQSNHFREAPRKEGFDMTIDELKDETLAVGARALVSLYDEYAEKCEQLTEGAEAFANWVAFKGRRPARKTWPDWALDPKLNGVSERLDDEAAELKRFRPGELPEEVVAAGEKYMAAEVALTEALEEVARCESLAQTRTCDFDLWGYVTRRRGIERFNQRTHEMKIDEKIRRKKECYYANSRALYQVITELMKGNGKREREESRTMARIEKKLDVVVSEEPIHCWDALRSKVRRAQVKAVWQRVKAARAEGKEVELHAECFRAFRQLKMGSMPGGYPNFHALYKFCREHETEF